MGNRRRLPLELLVFVVGSATLGSEIAVARLIAPFFGDSTIVWANTIAVVLVALSIGYWFGGRLADRHPHLDGLCMLVLGLGGAARGRADRRAAAALALGRRVRRRVDRRLRGLAVRRARAGLDPGADARRGVAVGDPAEAAQPRGLRARRPGACTRSRPSARWSGTFSASLLLIPLVGTQRTFLVYAFALALVAALGLGRRWLPAPRRAWRCCCSSRSAPSRRPTRARSCTRPRRPTSTRAWSSTRTAGASSSSTRARRSTRSGAATRCSPATTGTAT